mgnify:CR=1 FL=1
MELKLCCGNCAYASVSYPAFKESCDLDAHAIQNSEDEVCGKHLKITDGEDDVDGAI